MEEGSNVQTMETVQNTGAKSSQQEQPQQAGGGQKKEEQGQEQSGGESKGLLGTLVDLVKDMLGVDSSQGQGTGSGQQQGPQSFGELRQVEGNSITQSQESSISLSQETASSILNGVQLDFGGSSPASPADSATSKSPDAGVGVQQSGQEQSVAM